MTVSLAVALVLLALLVGVLLGAAVARARTGRDVRTAEEERAGLQAELAAVQDRLVDLASERAAAVEARAQLEDRLRDADARSVQDNNVLRALAPVAHQLRSVEEHVAALERDRAEQYGGITQALAHTREVGDHLRTATTSLSSALRSGSARGTWGEVQLRRVVEAAGMTAHVDFREQVASTGTTADGERSAIRPDMVVHLPGGRDIVLDAKAPMTAYLRAQDAGDDDARRAQLSAHAKAVRGHVDALASKKYWEARDASPELVLCFLPAESALSAALDTDPTLLDHAAGRNVALVSPVSLLASLKAVAFTWRQHGLAENAKELFDLSRQLYERLGTVGKHLDDMGRSLQKSVETYNRLAGSVETRVFPTARRINDLDPTLAPDDRLSTRPLVVAPRPLTAPEFTEAQSTGAESTGAQSTAPKVAAPEVTGPEPGAARIAAAEPSGTRFEGAAREPGRVRSAESADRPAPGRAGAGADRAAG
ncbi:DNA recombination protein RmuC [Kocuria sp. SM24M-10]|uniref:DNA recombination protein RmuC n=1 Tax=Kocuria sp. SM24M-10 TaxID=1660349 RepID=UPI0009E3744E|nr:DNA recombination protein RmuC [Kocuria sp. SM24M-10]